MRGSPLNRASTACSLLMLALLCLPESVSGQPSRSTWSTFTTRDAQTALQELGYDPGPIDGQEGSRTRAAIREFQRDYGIVPTGQIDAETRTSIVVAGIHKESREGALTPTCTKAGVSPIDAHISFAQFAAKHVSEVGRIYDFRTLLRGYYESSSDPFLDDLTRWIGHHPHERSASPGLLVYDHDGDVLRAWLITSEGLVAYHQLAIDLPGLRNIVGDLRYALGLLDRQKARAPVRRGVVASDPEVAPPSPRLSVDHAIRNLSRVLFSRECGAKLRSVSHLIVVPTSVLWTVPFALLRPWEDEAHLIDEIVLVMSPSLIDLTSDYGLWTMRRERGEALVVGNPSFPFQDDAWTYPALPGAETEAIEVAARLGVKPLLGEHATKEAVIERSSSADVLYFATHGVAAAVDPLESNFLLLAGQPGRDSRWTLEEIQRTRFQARLAVLSACQTGLGQVFDAGILGLARGFHISGVPRIAISLWKVDDEATRDLMVTFMQAMQTGNLYPPEALRVAMQRTRQMHSDPAEWASFVIFGALW